MAPQFDALSTSLFEIEAADFTEALPRSKTIAPLILLLLSLDPVAAFRPTSTTRSRMPFKMVGSGQPVRIDKSTRDDLKPRSHGFLDAAWRTILSCIMAIFITISPVSPLLPITAAVADMPYIPRVLYPGTYGNYCGPTPEVGFSGACLARGWHGDDPIDQVDAACLRHDLAYCTCSSELRARAGAGATPSSLSVLTALRSTGLTRPFLESRGADATYFSCVREADKHLIQDGITVRRTSQRSECSAGDYDMPSWFCKLNSLTLARIEFVDFDLFLRNLDADAFRRTRETDGPAETQTTSVAQLEWERRFRLRSEALNHEKQLSEAARGVDDLERSMESILQLSEK